MNSQHPLGLSQNLRPGEPEMALSILRRILLNWGTVANLGPQPIPL